MAFSPPPPATAKSFHLWPLASRIFFSSATDLASPPEVHQCRTSTSPAREKAENANVVASVSAVTVSLAVECFIFSSRCRCYGRRTEPIRRRTRAALVIGAAAARGGRCSHYRRRSRAAQSRSPPRRIIAGSRRHSTVKFRFFQGTPFMTIRVAINGYGRIGRNILRAHYEGGKKHDIQIVAINDLGDAKINAHLTKYDTAHGKFPGSVAVDGDFLVVNGDKIKVLRAEESGRTAVERTRRGHCARVHRSFHQQGQGRRASERGRKEGHHLRAGRQGRGCDRGVRRKSPTCLKRRTP